jgi:hypothetical protein
MRIPIAAQLLAGPASKAAPIVVLLAAVSISAFWFVEAGMRTSIFRDWVDDSFFYVIVAGNIVDGHGSTSDGLGVTNGYHPLWMLVHVAIRVVVDNPIPPLVLVQFTLLAAGVLLLYRFLAPYSGQLVALLLCVLATVDRTFLEVLGSGMETHLAWVALILVLLALRAPPFPSGSWRDLVPLQAALAVLFFARLDGGLLWIALALVVLLRGYADCISVAGRIRLLFRLFIPPAACAAAYFAFNQVAFGTAVPISGRIKAVRFQHVVDTGVLEFLGTAFDRLVMLFYAHAVPGLDRLSLWQPRAAGRDAVLWTIYLLIVALAAAVVLRSLARRSASDLAVPVLGGYVLLHAAYYTLLQSDRYSLSWGRGPELLLLVTIAAVGVCRVPLPRWAPAIRRLLAVVAVVAALGVVWHGSRDRAAQRGVVRDFKVSTRDFLRGANHVRAITSDHDVIVSESIGFLGYYSGRRIISLDGLLNSMEYYRTVLLPGRTAAYLHENGVRILGNAVWKGGDAALYAAGIFGVPPECVRVSAEFNWSKFVPRRYVVVESLYEAEAECARGAPDDTPPD